jgi:Fe-Mn family superoxide dismutase
MKVSIKYENSDLKQYQDFVKKFINLLQDEYPLKDDIRIEFLNGRKGEMSTGSRRGDHLIKVLAKKRLNRDIMRTLAHEWVHEYQFAILNREHGPNIGGRNEDEANAVAGQIVKKFEKKYPKLEKLMYEGTGIEGKLNLLTEQILIEEKTSVQNDLLLEMKKVGIEKLPYSYSSLGRFIDTKTMNIHYNKHYKGYVDKLNKALKDVDGDMELEEIVKSISKFDNKVRNNAGGAFNHALFWKMLSPKKQKPKGNIFDKIKEDFGNIKKMKDKFNEAAKDRFGSGWAWLYLTKNGDLEIMSTPNQDNPLMNVVKKGGYPLLGLDVWEHAYYLKYQNKRDEYIEKFWDVVNWEFVEELYNQHTKKKNLKESVSEIIEEQKINKTRLDVLCGNAEKRQIEESPFCRLKEFRDSLQDQYLTDSINNSIESLDKFFHKKNVGVFPMIVKLSLENLEKTREFLDLIALFIDDESFDDDYTKKVLKKQKNTTKVPDNLEDLLAYARYKEHQKYEDRFVGRYFNKKATKLQLNYHCSDDAKEKLIDTLMKIHNKEETINYHFFRIAKCLSDSFKSGTYYIKSDVEVSEDLKDEEGNVIYPKGTLFEIKKMDPFIDSYLSEFFSIFKQSSVSDKKPIIGQLYNELIDKIYNWVSNNDAAKKYLQKVKDQISGIIYESDYIVPIEYIQLYWSDKGQRGCDEKRLSIRFRIDPKYSEIKGYKFVDSDTLESKTIPVPQSAKELVICRK